MCWRRLRMDADFLPWERGRIKEGKLNYPMDSHSSPLEDFTWGHNPSAWASSFLLPCRYPCPPSPRHPSTAYTYLGTHDNRPSKIQAPGISEMASRQEIISARCLRTGGLDESRGRADGTSATCAPLLGACRAATRSLHTAPVAVNGESGNTVSSGSCSNL